MASAHCSLMVLAVQLLAITVRSEVSCGAGGNCGPEEEQALLQLMRGTRDESALTYRPPFDLSGKSVYLIMVDRFNRVSPLNKTVNEECEDVDTCKYVGSWCGGTLKGITEKLDYIQGMGFDAVWITPVVKQPALEVKEPPTEDQCKGESSGYCYHGYCAEDYYQIDPSYGTSQDLKDLAAGLHERNMGLILDIVLNHMRPIHVGYEGWEVETINPFNKAKYYHRRSPIDRAGGQDFANYTRKFCNWPSPFQAFGPGSMCYLKIDASGTADYTNGGHWCDNYKGSGLGPRVYDNTTYLGPAAPGPRELKYCGVGDYCPGYTDEALWEGWFYSLADLNHSVPYVRRMQFWWIRQMRRNYSLDGIRLDTAPYMPWEFLKEFQEKAAPLQILGEVTTVNMSFHASFQSHRELGPVLTGLQNHPPFYAATPGYCNDSTSQWSPIAMGTLKPLAEVMAKQLTSGLYTDTTVLATMVDNQDAQPIASLCSSTALVKNALAWLLMSYGIPIVTWGTEQGNKCFRQAQWTQGFSTETWQYNFIKNLNWVRKRVATAKTSIMLSSENKLVFLRGDQASGVWIFTNNFKEAGPVEYDVAPCATGGSHWTDAITGNRVKIVNGTLRAADSDPLVLYLK